MDRGALFFVMFYFPDKLAMTLAFVRVWETSFVGGMLGG